jgi:hypothetical protein
MAVDPDFFVDFHDRPAGPARAHEVRLRPATAQRRSSSDQPSLAHVGGIPIEETVGSFTPALHTPRPTRRRGARGAPQMEAVTTDGRLATTKRR